MDTISTPQRPITGQGLDAAVQFTAAFAGRSPSIFSSQGALFTEESGAAATTSTLGHNHSAVSSNRDAEALDSQNRPEVWPVPNESDGEDEILEWTKSKRGTGTGTGTKAGRPYDEEHADVQRLLGRKDSDRRDKGLSPVQRQRQFRQELLRMSFDNAQLVRPEAGSADITSPEQRASEGLGETALGVSSSKNESNGHEAASTNDTPTEQPGGQRLPSPAWSSDSDNRLIKAVSMGKTIDSLKTDFPMRGQAVIQRRVDSLFQQEAPGPEEHKATIETPVLDEDTGRAPATGSSDETSVDQLVTAPNNEEHAKELADEQFLDSLVNKDSIESIGNGNAIDALADMEPDEAFEDEGTTGHLLSTVSPETLEAEATSEAPPGNPPAESFNPSSDELPVQPSLGAIASNAKPSYPQLWTQQEDETLAAGIKLGQSLEVTSKDLPSRSVGALKQRMLRLVEMQLITEGERQAALGASNDQTHEPHQQLWTEEEDEQIRIGIKAGQTLDVLVRQLTGRTLLAVKQRLYRLVRSGTITEAEKQSLLEFSRSQPTGSEVRVWTDEEDNILAAGVKAGEVAETILKRFSSRSLASVKARCARLVDSGKITEIERLSFLEASRSLPSVTDPRIWTEDEDHVLSTAVKAGQPPEAVVSELAGRTLGAVKSRTLKLVETEQITEHERLAFLSASRVPTSTTTSTQDPRIWTQDEMDILFTGVKAGESSEAIAKKLVGRTVAGVKARIARFDELKKFIEKSERRQNVFASAAPSKWTIKEDALLLRGLRTGKTAVQTANTLPMRSEGAVLRRRLVLVHGGQFDAGEHFTSSSSHQGLAAAESPTAFASSGTSWTDQDDDLLRKYMAQGLGWTAISKKLESRSPSAVCNRWAMLKRLNKTELLRESTATKASAPSQATPTSATKIAGLPWSEEEDRRLVKLVGQGRGWSSMAGLFGDRSTGSFANRYNLLVSRGKVAELAAASNASGGLSSDDDSASGGARSKQAGAASCATHSKRKRLDNGDSDDAISPVGMIQVPRNTQAWRKSASTRPIPQPDSSDMSSDDHDTLTNHVSRGHAASATSRGGRVMRGISRPVPSTHRQISNRASHFGQRINGHQDTMGNSVDRLSTSRDAADGDTIYVSGGPSSSTQQESSAKRRKMQGGASVMGRVDAAGPPPAFNARASVQMDDRELDATLAAQREEIENLKARLAKFEQLARQNREIAELKKQLGRYETDPPE